MNVEYKLHFCGYKNLYAHNILKKTPCEIMRRQGLSHRIRYRVI